MGYKTSRLFGYQGTLGAVYSGAPAETAPVGGPAGTAGDFNPTQALVLESYQSGSTFTVCGSDFDSVSNVWAEAFWTNPSLITTAAAPPTYTGTATDPTLRITSVVDPIGSPRSCFSVPLGSSVATLGGGWKLSLRFHQNAKGNVFSVPVVAGSNFNHTDPTLSPIGVSTITPVSSLGQTGAILACGTGLYASRKNIYALAQWTQPNGVVGTPTYFFAANPSPNPEPSSVPSQAVLSAGSQTLLYRYIDPTTRLQCGAIPFSAADQALLAAGWQVVFGIGDGDSGQEVRAPLQ